MRPACGTRLRLMPKPLSSRVLALESAEYCEAQTRFRAPLAEQAGIKTGIKAILHTCLTPRGSQWRLAASSLYHRERRPLRRDGARSRQLVSALKRLLIERAHVIA